MKIFKIVSIIICLCILINSYSFSEKKIITRTVEGYGISYNEAIQNALIEVIKQTQGVKIQTKRVYIRQIKEIGVVKNKKSSHYVGIDSFNKNRVRELTNGFIQEYRILKSERLSNYKWRVKLFVKIAKYKTPGFSPHNRRKIAVFPFRYKQRFFKINGKNFDAKEISRIFTQKIVEELTQSRKFTVLDREYIDEILKEKNIILSKDAPISEQIKIGQVLGVDYLLVGTINGIEIKKIPYYIDVSGERGFDFIAYLNAEYRIIVMATRQIKWADSVNIKLKNKDLNSLLEKGSKDIVLKALDNIYPIRIVEVISKNSIILNQGGKTVNKGEVLEIYKIGKKLYDPYTKEFLGFAEIKIGEIIITRVNPKLSYGKLIQGNISLIKKGYICRRKKFKLKNKNYNSIRKKSDVKINKNGGIILPFDR